MISQKNKRFDVQNIDLTQNSRTIFLVKHRSQEIMPSVLTTKMHIKNKITKNQPWALFCVHPIKWFHNHLLWLSMSFPRAPPNKLLQSRSASLYLKCAAGNSRLHVFALIQDQHLHTNKQWPTIADFKAIAFSFIYSEIKATGNALLFHTEVVSLYLHRRQRRRSALRAWQSAYVEPSTPSGSSAEHWHF